MTGDEAERDLTAELAGAVGEGAVDLGGRLSLRGLVGLLSRADLLIANDTWPLHVARVVGTCTVGIYWCGNLIAWGPMTRARNRTAISWRLECPLCGASCTVTRCDHAVSYVDLVEVHEVMALASDLLPREA